MEIVGNGRKMETLMTMEIANAYCEANDAADSYKYLEIEVYDWQAYGAVPVPVETGDNCK
jgi:elongation factor P--beta-lysine ligase